MSMDYAAAGDLLEAFGRAWQTFDGDGIVALFTADAEYHADLFAPPLVGHNAIRAYWLDGAATTRDVEFTVERHWVSADTVLCSWHATYAEIATGVRVRLVGFMTLETVPDGRIARLREWTLQAPPTAG